MTPTEWSAWLTQRGLPRARADDGGAAVVRSLHGAMMQQCSYVFDHEAKPSLWVKFPEGKREYWRSKAADWRMMGTFAGDCDKHAVTGIHLAIAHGVNPRKIDLCVGASETSKLVHDQTGQPLLIDHCWAEFVPLHGPRIVVFDTWDRARFEQCPPVRGDWTDRHMTAQRLPMDAPQLPDGRMNWRVDPEWDRKVESVKYADVAARPPVWGAVE
jgi:hypothetical protein